MSLILILAAGALIAGVNGANDVSKGIATLAGSGVTGYRRAILWGTAWTAVGGIGASVFAGAMITTFGNGLLNPGEAPSMAAAASMILGAAAWVLIATRTGWPVSTTHAIVGALAGVGAVAYGAEGVRWSVLGSRIFLPLLLSPLVALGTTVLLVQAVRRFAGPAAATADCLCAEVEPCLAAVRGDSPAAQSIAIVPGPGMVSLTLGDLQSCTSEHPAAVRLSVDHLHWLTSGATCFARGMNDAPKMAAMILAVSALSTGAQLGRAPIFAVITLGMVAGSIVAGLRVTRVLAERITEIDHRGGFLANLVTSVLVTAGAVGGLPMSTTHVAAGAIIGAGAGKGMGALNGKTIRDMLLAWIVTVPGAAALGLLAYLAFGVTIR
ncbi:MAG: inorganic phosphate transporter [Acidobacteria bacterium]|nr:inorganic phosphate transporter [Acidobacteriota bacterium]